MKKNTLIRINSKNRKMNEKIKDETVTIGRFTITGGRKLLCELLNATIGKAYKGQNGTQYMKSTMIMKHVSQFFQNLDKELIKKLEYKQEQVTKAKNYLSDSSKCPLERIQILETLQSELITKYITHKIESFHMTTEGTGAIIAQTERFLSKNERCPTKRLRAMKTLKEGLKEKRQETPYGKIGPLI